MFSKYDPGDAPAELDGLQKIPPEHLHNPETPSINESLWRGVVEKWD